MIRYYNASRNDDTASNGGAIRYTSQITDSALDNIFPSIEEDERESDLTRNRKIFGRYTTLIPTKYRNVYAMVKVQPTCEDDIVYISNGTATDTQADISGYTWHGSGMLGNALTGGTSDEIIVTTREEGGFNDDDIIFIGELGGDGVVTSYFELLSVTGASYSPATSGYTLTGITNTVSGDTVRRSFLTPSATVVCSCVDIGTLEAEAYDLDNSNVSGGSLIQLPDVTNLGSIDDEWTLEFTDVGIFEVSRAGDPLADIEEYTTSSTVNVMNYVMGSPYFTIEPEYWGLTPSAGTITFKTKSTNFALWLKQFVPSGSSAYRGSTGVISTIGE